MIWDIVTQIYKPSFTIAVKELTLSWNLAIIKKKRFPVKDAFDQIKIYNSFLQALKVEAFTFEFSFRNKVMRNEISSR